MTPTREPLMVLAVRNRDGYLVTLLPDHEQSQAEIARWQRRGRSVAREPRGRVRMRVVRS